MTGTDILMIIRFVFVIIAGLNAVVASNKQDVANTIFWCTVLIMNML